MKKIRKLVLISIETYHSLIEKHKDNLSNPKIGKINYSFCIECGLKYIRFSRIATDEVPDYYVFELMDEKKLFLSKIKYPDMEYTIVERSDINISDTYKDIDLSVILSRNPYSRRLYCNDGFSISVKSGKYYHSVPKTENGPWSAFELGYPTLHPSDELLEFAEDPIHPLNTIYSYVPEWVVLNEFALHGGLILCMKKYVEMVRNSDIIKPKL